MIDPPKLEANRVRQVELYGMSIADMVRTLSATLGMNQTQIAHAIGLSGAMMSQLIAGGRVKIGNPVVSTRLSELRMLADGVVAGTIPSGEVPMAIEQIRMISTTQGTTTSAATPSDVEDQQLVQALQDLFRSVAGAQDWLAVADLAQDDHPQIAKLLRTYGAARTDEALRYYAATKRH